MIKRLLYFIVWIAPKLNYVTLRGFPSYEDNLVAIYRQLPKWGFKKIIWVVDDVESAPPIKFFDGTKKIKRGSLTDIFYSSISKYLFLTHGHFLEELPQSQTSINLWHGIPYKAIGTIDGKAGRKDTHVVATSEFTKRIFAESFDVDPACVIITGQPRTDLMFNMTREELCARAFPEPRDIEKVFFWMPTYRTTNYSGGRVDGNEFDNVYNCSDFDEEQLNDHLSKTNSVLFVKPHPMAVRGTQKSLSNIIHIDQAWLEDRQMTLYEMLGATDCLISDISSVICDYMLLNRPIILLFEDFDEYKIKRGFSFDPIEDFLPSRISKDFDAFFDDLKSVTDGHDVHHAKRRDLVEMFFENVDDQAATRVLTHTMGPLAEDQKA